MLLLCAANNMISLLSIADERSLSFVCLFMAFLRLLTGRDLESF